MTALQAAAPESWDINSRIRRNDELVLATQALKAGTDETMLSRFGDDRWDLAPAIFRENVRVPLRLSISRRSMIRCSA